jgi:hypothetical protein
MVGNYIHLMQQGIADPSHSMANGGGKDGGSAPAPDYRPMAEASKEAAEIGAALGREQLAENKRQFEVNQSVLKPVLDESVKTQQLANKQGEENYNRLTTEGRPIQDQMKTIAMGGDYNDAQKAKQEEAAGAAIADSRTGSNQQVNQLIRQGLRYGWSPAKLAAMGGSAATASAQNQVASANAARTQKQTQQWGQMGDTYNTYAGLGSQAPAFYNAGTSAGNSASGTQLGMSGQYMQGIGQGNGTIMQGQGMKVQGLGSILNSQTSMYNASQNQGDGGFGAMIGAGGSIAAAMI